MEAEARYTFVGASVLVLIAALVAGLVWLKNVGGGDNFERFAIHFEQQALDGLEIGADVTLRGIKVGRVEDYALSGTTLNRVRVEVRVDRRAPVRTNTTAVVDAQLRHRHRGDRAGQPRAAGRAAGGRCPKARVTRSLPKAAPTSTRSPAASTRSARWPRWP